MSATFPAGEGLITVLALLFGVIFIIVGATSGRPRAILESPLQVLVLFLKLMPVGEDIILPFFYKIKSISISASHPE